MGTSSSQRPGRLVRLRHTSHRPFVDVAGPLLTRRATVRAGRVGPTMATRPSGLVTDTATPDVFPSPSRTVRVRPGRLDGAAPVVALALTPDGVAGETQTSPVDRRRQAVGRVGPRRPAKDARRPSRGTGRATKIPMVLTRKRVIILVLRRHARPGHKDAARTAPRLRPLIGLGLVVRLAVIRVVLPLANGLLRGDNTVRLVQEGVRVRAGLVPSRVGLVDGGPGLQVGAPSV